MRSSVRLCLDAIPGAEVFAESEEGKLVVVLDTADHRLAADKITAIQNQAGVFALFLHPVPRRAISGQAAGGKHIRAGQSRAVRCRRVRATLPDHRQGD